MLLLWHLKSYLPAHSILRGFVALHLCDFADAIRTGCAEAKLSFLSVDIFDFDAIRTGCAEAKLNHNEWKRQIPDAIRTGCAEAKILPTWWYDLASRCNPYGVC